MRKEQFTKEAEFTKEEFLKYEIAKKEEMKKEVLKNLVGLKSTIPNIYSSKFIGEDLSLSDLEQLNFALTEIIPLEERLFELKSEIRELESELDDDEDLPF